MRYGKASTAPHRRVPESGTTAATVNIAAVSSLRRVNPHRDTIVTPSAIADAINVAYCQVMDIDDEGHNLLIDDKDVRILEALHFHGRASWPTIGELAECSATTARRRFTNLKNRHIVRVAGALNVQRTGIAFPILTRVKCHSTELTNLSQKLQNRPEARFVTTVTGTADCVVELVVDNYADLEWLIPEIFPNPDWQTETFPIMKTFTSAHDWSPFGSKSVHHAPESWNEPIMQHHDPAESGGSSPLSAIEHEVVRLLMHDGRMAITDLAAAIGTSESTANRVVRGLLESDRLSIRVLVEPGLIGYECEFMVWLSIASDQLEEAGCILAQHPASKYLSSTLGRYNLAGQMVLPQHADLYSFMTEVLGVLPGIQRVDVTLQLNTYKRLWTPVSGPRVDQAASTVPQHNI